MRIFSLILLFLIGMCISGCGLFSKKEPEMSKTIFNQPRLSENLPKREDLGSKRELGSLWSENSHWNSLYSTNSIRKVGSMIFIKPTPRLHELMDQQIPNPQENILDKDKKQYVIKDNQKKKYDYDGAYIMARIEEVLPRGIYRITSDQSTRIRGENWRMNLNGKVREQDISDEDLIQADAIFDLRLEIPDGREELQRRRQLAQELFEKERSALEEQRLAAEEKERLKKEKEEKEKESKS